MVSISNAKEIISLYSEFMLKDGNYLDIMLEYNSLIISVEIENIENAMDLLELVSDTEGKVKRIVHSTKTSKE